MQVKTIGQNGSSLVVPNSYQELQENNSRQKWREVGTTGLNSFSGFVTQAYNTQLYWPGVHELYNRLRRSCPPIVVTRQFYGAQAGSASVEVVLPDDPNDNEKRLGELFESDLENMDGGFYSLADQYLAHVPFMGWGWWEVLPGVRSHDWRPPDNDPWESEADDNYIGIRRLAWRDHGSFERWELDDRTGRLFGMWQNDPPNKSVMIPLSQSFHATFGDSTNPEGLTPLEAAWRLERLKYGYQVTHGIGSERAAGYLDVKKTEAGQLTDTDKANIRNAARSILSAQEGNYAIWPFGFDSAVKDIMFAAAKDIHDMIKWLDLCILQLYNMEWVAIATTAGTGSYNARETGSAVWLVSFNRMWDGAIRQYDEQVGKRLYKWNQGAFPGARRPKYKAKPLDKPIGLDELAQFWQAVNQTMPVGEDDYVAIRTKSGILPESLPEPEEGENMVEGTPEDEGLQAAGVPTARSILLDVRQQEMTVEAAVELLISIGMKPEAARKAAQSQADAEPIPTNPIAPQRPGNNTEDEDEEQDDKDENEPGGTDEDDGELSLATNAAERTILQRLMGSFSDLKDAILGGDEHE